MIKRPNMSRICHAVSQVSGLKGQTVAKVSTRNSQGDGST
jgi:hypothetical protein